MTLYIDMSKESCFYYSGICSPFLYIFDSGHTAILVKFPILKYKTIINFFFKYMNILADHSSACCEKSGEMHFLIRPCSSFR